MWGLGFALFSIWFYLWSTGSHVSWDGFFDYTTQDDLELQPLLFLLWASVPGLYHARDWTLDFTRVRQALYQMSCMPSPVLFSFNCPRNPGFPPHRAQTARIVLCYQVQFVNCRHSLPRQRLLAGGWSSLWVSLQFATSRCSLLLGWLSHTPHTYFSAYRGWLWFSRSCGFLNKDWGCHISTGTFSENIQLRKRSWESVEKSLYEECLRWRVRIAPFRI